MRRSMRRVTGMLVIALFVVLPVLATGAGAQVVPGEGAPPSPGTCSFLIGGLDGNGQAPSGSTSVSVTVTGTVPTNPPDGVVVQLFVSGAQVDSQLSTNGTYAFGPLTVPVPVDVSVNYTYGNENAYTTGCAGPGGTTVYRIVAAGAAAARALALTGSSNTATHVLAASAAIVFGAVLVMATRRRTRVQA